VPDRGSPVPTGTGLYLWLLCVAACAVRLGSYYLRPGILAPDEVFQYLEQAHRLVFHVGLVPWEYVLGIRNWLIPGAIAGIMQAARVVGDTPAVQVGAVTLCMTLLSLCTVVCAFRWGCNIGGTAAGLAAGGLNAFWFEQIYYAVHPIADTIAASLLMSGLYLASPSAVEPARKRLFWAGVLFGLTLVVRIQLGPAVALAALWICRSAIWGRTLPMICGGVIPLCALGIVDALTWGSPFQSIWLYVWLNTDISAAFGASPFYALIGQAFINWSVFGGLIVVLAVLGVRRLPVIGIAIVAIVVTFSLVAHKEPRFLYPAEPLILTLVGIGSAELGGGIAARLRVPLSPPSLGLVLIVFWTGVSVGLGCFGPFHGYWSSGTGTVAAFRLINADPDACGVAVVPANQWPQSGGYVFLRPGIPLVSMAQAGSGAAASRYNYVFTYDTAERGDTYDGADRVNCWNQRDSQGYAAKVCLWRVRMGCVSGHSVPLVAAAPSFVTRWTMGR
jgi:GPI mannosyltransferase 3